MNRRAGSLWGTTRLGKLKNEQTTMTFAADCTVRARLLVFAIATFGRLIEEFRFLSDLAEFCWDYSNAVLFK